jgi:GH15 family glucan-1,4-alpha-glucosidase
MYRLHTKGRDFASENGSRKRARLAKRFVRQHTLEDMAYRPIANYGVVGDLRTAALISQEGSVDWLCLPRFDSPSVFAAILDDQRGGYFSIAPCADNVRCRQLYEPDTNILVTRFMIDGAVIELTDFMPLQSNLASDQVSWLVRRAKVIRGTARLELRCEPGFGYGALPITKIDIEGEGATLHGRDSALHLSSPVQLKSTDSGVTAQFELGELQTASFILSDMPDARWKHSRMPEESIDELESATALYWRNWINKSTYQGRWREMVHRSALLLQLLTYAPSGAIIAAPTCSLPEWIGGERNWDYRFNWIRDAAYTIYALERIGLFDEASRFMNWIEERSAESFHDGPLQTVYAVDGNRDLHEKILDNLDGYRGSKPVRVGNDAYKQVQLDIYGALIDAVYLYNKYAQPITGTLWRDIRRLTDWVCENWHRHDQGIWELRGDPRPLVHSKVMCWVALDRALRLAAKRSLPADLARWVRCRDCIYEEVVSKGWNPQRKAFVQSYGSNILDASVLMMPLVFFMTPDDPMMTSTVDAICKPRSQGGLLSDGMVYRYEASTDDGLGTREGTFNVCTLWLIEALTRMGRTRQAHWLFEKMLSRANQLGLYSEEMSSSGEQLGNFPQALTHMGLISAAYNLDRTLNAEGKMA